MPCTHSRVLFMSKDTDVHSNGLIVRNERKYVPSPCVPPSSMYGSRNGPKHPLRGWIDSCYQGDDKTVFIKSKITLFVVVCTIITWSPLFVAWHERKVVPRLVIHPDCRTMHPTPHLPSYNFKPSTFTFPRSSIRPVILSPIREDLELRDPGTHSSFICPQLRPMLRLFMTGIPPTPPISNIGGVNLNYIAVNIYV